MTETNGTNPGPQLRDALAWMTQLAVDAAAESCAAAEAEWTAHPVPAEPTPSLVEPRQPLVEHPAVVEPGPAVIEHPLAKVCPDEGGNAPPPEDRALPDAAPEAPLKTRQLKALELIAIGMPIARAAHAAGVDRRTIYRWMKEDDDFITALADWRRRTRQIGQDRLLRLSRRALEVLETALLDGNLHASLTVLKGVGLLDGADRASRAPLDVQRIERSIGRVVEQKFAMQPLATRKELLAIVTSSLSERLTKTFEERR